MAQPTLVRVDDLCGPCELAGRNPRSHRRRHARAARIAPLARRALPWLLVLTPVAVALTVGR